MNIVGNTVTEITIRQPDAAGQWRAVVEITQTKAPLGSGWRCARAYSAEYETAAAAFADVDRLTAEALRSVEALPWRDTKHRGRA